MTEKERAELYELLDALIYAHLSVQQCRRDKTLHAVERFVDGLVDSADKKAKLVVQHAQSAGNP